MSAGVVAAFRRAADLIEQHDIPAPVVVAHGGEGLLFWAFYGWEENVPAKVAAIRRAVGGKWDKRESATGDQMSFVCEGYQIQVDRETVCERRVVGTETVVVPAVEAQPARTETRDLVEWDCVPILSEAVAS